MLINTTEDAALDGAYVIEMPMLVKAFPDGDRRIIEVEASNEACDSEGDVVLQKSLLDAAPAFLRGGHIDIDHISEIGHRLGIANPLEWIVGTPTEVRDLGGGRTAVRGELHKAIPGVVSKADSLWESLLRDPPVRWRASIFGYPTGGDSFVDTRVVKCPEAPDATRFVIKALDWRSLALTKNPINDSITGSARIVTMKSFIAKALLEHGLIEKGPLGVFGVGLSQTAESTPDMSMSGGSDFLLPRNRMELMGHHHMHIAKGKCPFAGDGNILGRSVASFRGHFMKCCGADYGSADLHALALMQALKHESKS